MNTDKNESLQIRDALPSDAPTLSQIHRIARTTAMSWLVNVHTDQETDAWMAAVVMPHQRVRVASFDGVVVGYSVFAGDWLEQLYIHPAHQNRGIGSRLFEDVRTTATKSFRLWVFQRNLIARRFYESRGCLLLELTDGQANEEREPDAMYECK